MLRFDFDKIELLEMRTEATLIEQTIGSPGKDGSLQAWGKLFNKKLINRTMIGVLMMFFQRK